MTATEQAPIPWPQDVKTFDSLVAYISEQVARRGFEMSRDKVVALARPRWEDVLEQVDITPCPPTAGWCDLNGEHGWRRPWHHGAGFARSHRYHGHEVADGVTVEMDEWDPSHLVAGHDITSSTEVHVREAWFESSTEVETHVAALREAARIAFEPGDGPSDVAKCNTSPGRVAAAERAVLDAVRDWVDGDGRGIAVENAYAALWAARNEAAGEEAEKVSGSSSDSSRSTTNSAATSSRLRV